VILLLDPLPTLGEGIERDVLAARRLSRSIHSRSSNASSDRASLESRSMTDAEALDRTLIPIVYDHSLRIYLELIGASISCITLYSILRLI